MEWILILFVHAGVMSNADSMAITNVTGFKTQQECVTAGSSSKILVRGTTKDVVYVCVQKSK